MLVEDEYYFNHEFYYPPPRPMWVVREDGSGFDAASVAVTLTDISFVRLRESLPTELLEGNRTFSATISTAQRRFDPLHGTKPRTRFGLGLPSDVVDFTHEP